ncbi:MAG: tRNA epoxyqueuosine(34) reductase QueG [Planctomycetota bacterium]
MTSRAALTEQLKSLGAKLGFAKIGIAPAVTPTGFHRLLDWIADGYAADMQWMERRRDAYNHPNGVMPGTRSVIMAAMNYHDGTPVPSSRIRQNSSPGTPGKDTPNLHESSDKLPRIARYASGSTDYHDVLKPLLKQLGDLIRRSIPGAKTRVVIDTAPLLERDFGRLAGLGWFGKNTMLISRDIGSWFFLGAVLADVELDYDDAVEQTYCGTCTRCLDVCPTQAFPEPGVLDARRCISYLTIEHRHAPIPMELRDGIGEWLFGCDLCQDVCPWNRFAPEKTLPEFQSQPKLTHIDCRALLRMSDDDFNREFGDTPLSRPGRSGILRNAAIVLGNLGDRSSLPELRQATDDPDPLIVDAASWAIRRLHDE